MIRTQQQQITRGYYYCLSSAEKFQTEEKMKYLKENISRKDHTSILGSSETDVSRTSKKRLLTPIQQSQQTAVHMIDMINKRKRKLADKSIMPGWLKLFGQRWSDIPGAYEYVNDIEVPDDFSGPMDHNLVVRAYKRPSYISGRWVVGSYKKPRCRYHMENQSK